MSLTVHGNPLTLKFDHFSEFQSVISASGKIRNKKNSVFGHFSHSEYDGFYTCHETIWFWEVVFSYATFYKNCEANDSGINPKDDRG